MGEVVAKNTPFFVQFTIKEKTWKFYLPSFNYQEGNGRKKDVMTNQEVKNRMKSLFTYSIFFEI